jgi:small subunit ribosomal protein S9
MTMPAKKVLVVSGQRKKATARTVVRPGIGRIRINRNPLEIFEPEIAREKLMEPLIQAGDDAWKQLDMDITVSGGGYMGQAEAARVAIARGLWEWNKKSPHLKRVFTDYDRTLLAGDPRRKEPKKFGGPGARARDQKSYR